MARLRAYCPASKPGADHLAQRDPSDTMAPPLLTLRDVHLTFGGTPLLTGAELSVSEGDRLCLVGRNGSGKSTLLKIAAGMVEMDSGERFLQPGRTVRYLPQDPDLSAWATTLDYVNEGLTEGDDPYRGVYLLEVLGLTGKEDPTALSGGEARRAALARPLAPEPDILLLDEPTNHLDLPAIEWLEGELARSRSALVMISHDRRFLNEVVDGIVHLAEFKLTRYAGNYDRFERTRRERLEHQSKMREKQEAERAKAAPAEQPAAAKTEQPAAAPRGQRRRHRSSW